MNSTKLHEALSILKQYDPNGYIAAEHDQIWIGGPNPEEVMHPDVRDRLMQLGVSWDPYIEAWHAFV